MPEYMTVQEIADRCRVHPATIRRHIAAGRLKAVRIGRRVRVKAEDLERYLSQNGSGSDRAKGVQDFDLTLNEALDGLIGMIDRPDLADVSENKHRYLADAYAPRE